MVRSRTKARARQLGIDEAVGELLPEDKAKNVKRLQAEGRKVAVAGDDIDGAPSLAQADLSGSPWAPGPTWRRRARE